MSLLKMQIGIIIVVLICSSCDLPGLGWDTHYMCPAKPFDISARLDIPLSDKDSDISIIAESTHQDINAQAFVLIRDSSSSITLAQQLQLNIAANKAWNSVDDFYVQPLFTNKLGTLLPRGGALVMAVHGTHHDVATVTQLLVDTKWEGNSITFSRNMPWKDWIDSDLSAEVNALATRAIEQCNDPLPGNNP